MSENQCYAADKEAFGVEYDNTEDVTYQFYYTSVVGIGMMLICVLVYHLQGKPGMYDVLRPYLIIVNLTFFAWFVVL